MKPIFVGAVFLFFLVYLEVVTFNGMVKFGAKHMAFIWHSQYCTNVKFTTNEEFLENFLSFAFMKVLRFFFVLISALHTTCTDSAVILQAQARSIW